MKVALVIKESVYTLYSNSPQENTRRYVTDSPYAADIRATHDMHERSIDTIVAFLQRQGVSFDLLKRKELSPFTDVDYVLSGGGDGTLLDTSHYIRRAHTGIPVIGVNTVPYGNRRSVGHFCTTTADGLPMVFDNLDTYPRTRVRRLELAINGKKIDELVLNDALVAHVSPYDMSRYKLTSEGKTTVHKDSGFLIATPPGTTAFMYAEDGDVLPLDSDKFEWIVRSQRWRRLHFSKEISVESQMREGRIFIDVSNCNHEFTLADVLTAKFGNEPLTLFGDLAEKQKPYLTYQWMPRFIRRALAL